MIDNTLYKTSEHFIQSEKAKHYGDEQMATKIINTESALEAKRMGHKLKKPKEVKEWSEIAKEMCLPGIKAKFHQNPPLLLLLQSTDNQTIVEASYDNLWGTGIPLCDRNCLNQQQWKNTGILGEILMDIRRESHGQPSNITSQNDKIAKDTHSMTDPNITVSKSKPDMTYQNA